MMFSKRVENRQVAIWMAVVLLALCAFAFVALSPAEAQAQTRPAKTSITSIKAKGTTKISVAIKKSSGAKGYQIKYSQSSQFKKAKSIWTSKRSKTITSLKPGTRYYVKVHAYKKTSSGKKIYSAWSKTKKVRTWYRITYKLNGGKQAANQKTAYTYTSKTFSLKNPTKKGYDFKGWYTSSAYKTKVSKIKKGSSGNKVFYAKWSPKCYSITYELDGGENSPSNPETYLTSDKDIELSEPTKLCHEFLGWYKDEARSIPFAGVAAGSTGNIVVYAKWKEAHTPVWFDSVSVFSFEEETRVVEREFDVCNNPECPSYGQEVAPDHPSKSGLMCNTSTGSAEDAVLHHDAYSIMVPTGYCKCATCGCLLEDHAHTLQFEGYVNRTARTETTVHSGWWCVRCDCEVDKMHPNMAPADEMGHCAIWRQDIVEEVEHAAGEYELWSCVDCGCFIYGEMKQE